MFLGKIKFVCSRHSGLYRIRLSVKIGPLRRVCLTSPEKAEFMPRRIFYGWWVVCACFPIGLLVSGITVAGFTAFFEPFVKEFGWSYTQVSFAASLRGLEAGIFSPIIGVLVDRFGSRKLILAGTILSGLGLLLLSLTNSLIIADFYCLRLEPPGAWGWLQ
jgi:MFS family permease